MFSAFVKDFLTLGSLIGSVGKPSNSYLLLYILACLGLYCTGSVDTICSGNLKVTT